MNSEERAERPDGPPYRDRLIAVGTQHGKQSQLAPVFHRVLGAVLLTPPIDTDQFGTFTGEIPRTGTAIEAARAKATLAMRVSRLPRGLASEASYGPLPGSGIPGHEEILLFRDDLLGIEVLEGYRTAFVPGSCHSVASLDEVPDSLLATLPGQALIVRPNDPLPGSSPGLVKGIVDVATLRAAVGSATRRSADGLAAVEPDLRAQHNPSRRRILVRLAATLANRLATRCPACRTPGFGTVATEPGLPCRFCGTPTPLKTNDVHGCASCTHRVTRAVAGPGADPASCPRCNP